MFIWKDVHSEELKNLKPHKLPGHGGPAVRGCTYSPLTKKIVRRVCY